MPSQLFVLSHALYINFQFISWAIVLFLPGLVPKPPLKMAKTRAEKRTSTNSRCYTRHSTRSCFPAISAPTGQYSHFMEFSRSFQPQRWDILGAKMQNQWTSKLLCDWSFRRAVRLCHGNRFPESTVDVVQSFAASDKSPLFMQK